MTQLAERTGLATQTLARLERGRSRSPSAATLGKLDVGLQWQPGTALDLFDGRVPVELGDVEAHLTNRLDDLEMRLSQITAVFIADEAFLSEWVKLGLALGPDDRRLMLQHLRRLVTSVG